MTDATTIFTAQHAYAGECVPISGTGGAQGIAVVDSRVVAHGGRAELERRYPGAETVDFGTATITPGLIDGHMHAVWGTTIARGADLSGLHRREEVIDALRAEADRVADDDWVFGWGYEPGLIGEDPVTNDLLHEALGVDRPAYVTLFDAHSALMSRAGLLAAGVDEPRSFTDGGGFIAREDAADREGVDRLSGHILEFLAIDAVAPSVPRPSIAAQAATLRDSLEAMARTGLVGAYVPDAQPLDLVAVLEAIEDADELPLRLRISPWCTPTMSDAELEALVAGLGRGGRRWTFEGVKLFIDGTIDGGTAWLETPDRLGAGGHGFWHDPAQYARNVERLNELGVPTITHAIGDRGVRFVAETLAALPDRGLQHRIDHLELVADEVIDLIGANAISVCVQPTHCTLFVSPDHADTWSQRLGEPRNLQGWKTHRYLEVGAVEALGSDWPVAPYDPRTVIADAQLRHPHDRDTPPIHPEQALSAHEALVGYTSMVPRSVGHRGGALEVGEPADFTVWAADPLATAASELPEVRILATAIDGRLVFDDRD